MNTELSTELFLAWESAHTPACPLSRIFYTTNIQAGKYGDMVVTLLPIAVLFLAIREKRRTQRFLTLFGGIKTGVLVGLVSFPISVSFLWIYHHYINPNWLEFILDYERSAMISAGIGAEEISSESTR